MYAGYSSNNGTNWGVVLNPFSIFGSGFCCDQITVYDVSNDRLYWLLQYGNHLTVASAASTNPASWCFYNFSPALFGLPSTDAFDYNHMAVSTRYLYVSTNDYSTTSFRESVVFRLPLSSLHTPPTACGSVAPTFYGRSTEFSNALVQPATDTMYWWTDARSTGTGSTIFIARWRDDAAAASFAGVSVTPFTYMTSGAGICGSADHVVLNWCQRTDSRPSGGGYVAIPSVGEKVFSSGVTYPNDAILGVAVNARQVAGHPFPFIRRFYFRTSTLGYLGYSENWSSTYAVLYPDMAPDARGHIGEVWAWGGGTGTTHYFPGSGFTINDDLSPTQPWNFSLYLRGAGNACLNTSDNTRRWGDYLTIRPWEPSRNAWLATGFRATANLGACNTNQPAVEVHNIVFGRSGDVASYNRWKGV